MAVRLVSSWAISPKVVVVKHGNHDQSTHGNWAHGTVAVYASEDRWEAQAAAPDAVPGTPVARMLLTRYRGDDWAMEGVEVFDQFKRHGLATQMLERFHEDHPEAVVLHQSFASRAGVRFAESMVEDQPEWNQIFSRYGPEGEDRSSWFKKYAPDQPRDEAGRWSAGGGAMGLYSRNTGAGGGFVAAPINHGPGPVMSLNEAVEWQKDADPLVKGRLFYHGGIRTGGAIAEDQPRGFDMLGRGYYVTSNQTDAEVYGERSSEGVLKTVMLDVRQPLMAGSMEAAAYRSSPEALALSARGVDSLTAMQVLAQKDGYDAYVRVDHFPGGREDYEVSVWDAMKVAVIAERGSVAKYSPDQARVPAGSPAGGQFAGLNDLEDVLQEGTEEQQDAAAWAAGLYEATKVDEEKEEKKRYKRLAAALASVGWLLKFLKPSELPEMAKYSDDQPRDEQGRWTDLGGNEAPRLGDLDEKSAARIGKWMDTHEVNLDGMVADIKASFDDAEAVAAGKDWYREEFQAKAEELAAKYDQPIDTVTAVIAITSAQNRWSAVNPEGETWYPNLEVAERFLQLEADGKLEGIEGPEDLPPTGYLKGEGFGINAARLLDGQLDVDEAVTGTKRRSFYDNGIDPGASTEVTCDVWMGTYLSEHSDFADMEKVKQQLAGSGPAYLSGLPPAYYVTSEAVQQATEELKAEGRVSDDWLPHQTQAVAWVHAYAPGGTH